jgi:transketolase N-terminal domain/subunit
MSHLKTIEQRLLWLSHWMIHDANHVRPNPDGIKVGRASGKSSASMVSIMTALYFSALRPEDRVAVKPHAAPVFHAMQYLMGNQTREKLEGFRAFGGAQSYPSRTKDVDDVDFSTGSVGLGVGITALASMVQDFIAAKDWGRDIPQGRMVALVGDAEMDEGNVYEVLQEGWKNGLRNTWWIIDYNRQSLDGIVREGLFGRIEKIFEAFGWDVVKVKHGALQRAAFAEPGGRALRDWIDACPNTEYAALTYMGGAVWRKRLMDDLGDQGDVTALIDRRSDAELAALMENLGGNCVETMAETFARIDHDRPTCFLAYTIKGWGTPIAGHKDNHGGLMTKAQMAEWQRTWACPRRRSGSPSRASRMWRACGTFSPRVPFFGSGRPPLRRRACLPVPAIEPPKDREISTQAAFGKILDDLARGDSDARRTHRHDLARRDRHDKPRPLGQPPQALRAGRAARRLHRAPHPLDRQVELRPRGPACRARHRRDEPVPSPRRRGPRAQPLGQAAHPGGHGVRSFRPPRPRCAQLRLLPGRALHHRRHAVGRDARARGRRAPVHRHAAHRHGAGRPRRVSSPPSRTSSPSSWSGPSTICSATARAIRTSERGFAMRRAARSTCGSRPSHWSSRANAPTTPSARAPSTAPTGCARRGPTAQVVIAYQGAVADEAIAAAGLRARTAATSPFSPSPPPTGSTRAGRRPSVNARGAIPNARAHVERLLVAPVRATAPSLP